MPRFSRVRQEALEAQLRPLIEEQCLQHHVVAAQLGVSEDWVQRTSKRLGLTTQRHGPRSGEGHPDWQGGVVLIKGYRFVYSPKHPSVRYGRYVAEHRIVAERTLGRFLEPHEVVHHIDGDPLNNDPANLQVFQSNAEHLRHELTGRVPNWTEDGKRRIAEAGRKQGASRKKSAPDDGQPPQSTDRQT